MHKSSIIGKEGDEGLKGAMRKPNWQLSDMNLERTLSRRTIGGNRYRFPDHVTEKASMNLASGSGKREE